MNKNYFYQLFIALDQFLNVLLAGWADETLSSRSYRSACLVNRPKWRWKIAHKTIDTLFFWHKEHCLNAFLKEQERAHLAPIMRDKNV